MLSWSHIQIFLVQLLLRQKYYALQFRPNLGSNSWLPDHDSTLHVTGTPALTTQPSVTNFFSIPIHPSCFKSFANPLFSLQFTNPSSTKYPSHGPTIPWMCDRSFITKTSCSMQFYAQTYNMPFYLACMIKSP